MVEAILINCDNGALRQVLTRRMVMRQRDTATGAGTFSR
jgi:hypothetical protein